MFTHELPDDPIVFPGEPGLSHTHHFFGNDTTDAFSTPEDLVTEGDTSCHKKIDGSAYWAPALFEDDEIVQPIRVDAYYTAPAGADFTEIQAPPAGLRMIAGDSMAEEAPTTDVAGWACGFGRTLHPTVSPPDCQQGVELKLYIIYPDCWDGERVDSVDHKEHMAYRIDGAGELRLASGSLETAHADFVNGWDQDALVREVAWCIHNGVSCAVA
jgi:hypothetical protein